MTGGGPDGSSEVLLSYLYKQAYTNSAYGYGMAIGVVVFAPDVIGASPTW
jgi:N-acetylglucosamine transport system permease protein